MRTSLQWSARNRSHAGGRRRTRSPSRTQVEATRMPRMPSLDLNLVDPGAAAVPEALEGHVRRRALSRPSLPEDDLRETYPMLSSARSRTSALLTSGRGVLVHHDGARSLSLRRRPGLCGDGASRAAGDRSRRAIDNEFAPISSRSYGMETSRPRRSGGRPPARSARLAACSCSRSKSSWRGRPAARLSRLYGMAISYGNLSARKDERRFWMSASGVDKSRPRRTRPRHPARVGLRAGDRAGSS